MEINWSVNFLGDFILFLTTQTDYFSTTIDSPALFLISEMNNESNNFCPGNKIIKSELELQKLHVD